MADEANKYVEGILSGDRVILSKSITLIESTREEDVELGQAVLEKCLPHTGKSIRVGITGVPGVGKSTFIEALGSYVIEEQNQSLAVLAIDPSSERTKGSILGDKTRMNKLAQNPNAFIRPSPTSGTLGGVASTTREAILLCEAAGFDTIFVETVGVGQSETMVHEMVDFFLLLLVPGAGDELQGMKRGIVEMADLIAINKADGDNIQKAKQAQSEYKQALHLFPPSASGWQTKVQTCSSLNSSGVDQIWSVVCDFEQLMKEHELFESTRKEQNKHWLKEMVRGLMMKHLKGHPEIKKLMPQLEEQVMEGKISAYMAVRELLKYF